MPGEQGQAGGVSGARRELRLALVCYGGVSLSIYMHGATKEVHRLVSASRLLAEGSVAAERAPSATERIYGDLLARARTPDGARTDVVVDVLTGTSAGGINAIYLAKALAHDLPQDTLREVWLDKGDINELVRGPRFLPYQLRAAALLAVGASPLRGREMAMWLYDALGGMETEPRKEPRTLMPEGHPLKLFVTATDFYGYDRQVTIADPKTVRDRRHRHHFEFRYGDDEDMFTRADNLGLAFAARATSSVPGAFPPVSRPLFRSYLPYATGKLANRLFRVYELSARSADDTYFIDGAVLDDRPFGHAIDAIRRAQAEVEVDRRLLYLEPDPGSPTPRAPAKSPGLIATVLGAAAGIPSREPILDDLLEIARLNERVERTRDVIESSFEEIASRVRDLAGEALEASQPPDPETLAEWQGRLDHVAQADAGTTFATYVRTRIGAVVDGLAEAFCTVCDYPSDTDHAFLVRSVVRWWAHDQCLFEKVFPPSKAQLEFLRGFDLDHGSRRLQFVLAGLNWCYEGTGEARHPRRAELNSVKERLWRAICDLRDASSGTAFSEELRGEVTACFPADAIIAFLQERGLDGESYGQGKRSDLEAVVGTFRGFLSERLDGFWFALYRDLAGLLASWDPELRQDLLVRYLGFPLWDVLLYPIQTAARAGERDAVEVVRMSPADPQLLQVPGGGQKLEGVGFGHFRAFFKRSYRENDYLWGRLDAAERLIGLVIGERGPEHTDWCRRVFLAVLDEEEPALEHVAPLIGDLRRQATAL